MRSLKPSTFIQSAWLMVTVAYFIQWSNVPINGDAPPAEEPTPYSESVPLSLTSNGQGAALGSVPIKPGKRVTPKGWIRTKATFYGEPYDSHPSRYRTADGTPYDTDALFCAMWTGNSGQRIKLGTRIEVFWLNSGFTSFHVVRDRQRVRSNRKIDFPTGKWRELSGLPRSAGNAEIEWRFAR